MCIDLVKERTWLQSLNTMAKCGTILLCHISPFRISHLPTAPPPPVIRGLGKKLNSVAEQRDSKANFTQPALGF